MIIIVKEKLTITFGELFKSWLMMIAFFHQKSFSSIFINIFLIRLPKRSVGAIGVNFTIKFWKQETLR